MKASKVFLSLILICGLPVPANAAESKAFTGVVNQCKSVLDVYIKDFGSKSAYIGKQDKICICTANDIKRNGKAALESFGYLPQAELSKPIEYSPKEMQMDYKVHYLFKTALESCSEKYLGKDVALKENKLRWEKINKNK